MPSKLNYLPPQADLETRPILKACSTANRYLAELKGKASIIPNQSILINALSLEEAKDSSEIENIITTRDEMYKAALGANLTSSAAAKEVENYAHALTTGYQRVKEDQLLTIRHILAIQEKLENNNAGFRRQPGTDLKNITTGETVYTPPQDHKDIIELMNNLELFINDDSLTNIDPLIKMAIIHHQFESIHPFYDGNGRSGRILNILYLVLKNLLEIPILYLSRYIIQTKSEYYRLLQFVRDTNNWEEWILYILKAVEVTSQESLLTVVGIKNLMSDYKIRIRDNFKFYSQDLINNLFRHPYTRIEFLEQDLQVSRITATKYLEQLTEQGFLVKQKVWKNSYYINQPLFDLLSNPPRIET